MIEANGSTSLVQVADNVYLLSGRRVVGPPVALSGAAVTTGEFGAWTPFGAEPTASGYQVAWKFGGADQYLVWTTDVSGNCLSQTAVMSGHSLALESLEPSFSQDFNGDGDGSPHDDDRVVRLDRPQARSRTTIFSMPRPPPVRS